MTSALDFTPVVFGDYLLVRRLGAGGMGEVFLAKTTRLGGIEKLLVVKTLRAEHTADPEYVGRFIDEARVVVQLSHRNICQVFDVGRAADQYYLAMEHIDGRDLKTLLLRTQAQGIEAQGVKALGTVLSPSIAVFLAGEVLEALDYAHRLRDPATGQALHLVHRDVSPQNIMVNFEGEAKLIDFGLAHSRLKVERTRPDIVMGKMAYMAPEQARGEPLSPRVDVFALAVTLYEMLTGGRYYEGLSAPEVFDVVGGRTADGREYRPPRLATLDPAMRHILDEALRRDPERRTPGCAALKEALDAWLLERKLRAGTRQVRELLAEHFAAEQARDRELFARIRGERIRGAPARARPDETVRIAVDPSLFDTSGHAPAAGGDESGDVFASGSPPASAAPTTTSSTEEATQRVARREAAPASERSSRRGLVAGLAVAAVMVTAAVAVGVWQVGASSSSSSSPAAPLAPPPSDLEDGASPTGAEQDPPEAEQDPDPEPEQIQVAASPKARGAKSGKTRAPAKRAGRSSSTAKDPARRSPAKDATSEAPSQKPEGPPPQPPSGHKRDDPASVAKRTAALAGCGCDNLERTAFTVKAMDAQQLKSHLAKVVVCEASCRR